MSENQKAVVRRVFEEVWNLGNVRVLDEYLAPTFVCHDRLAPDCGPGLEGEKKRTLLYRAALPDLRVTLEDVIADDESVVVRWTSRGTHQGELAGIAPTGKQVEFSGITIVRFVEDKIAEAWISWDALGLLEQLGVVPEVPTA
jgi:predicted ester cyclase